MTLAEDLKKIIKGGVASDEKILESYSRDASLFVVRPEVVVAPSDTADICAVVKYVSAKAADIQGDALTAGSPRRRLPSITARAAGTDMGGGPLGNSIVLDMMHLNKLVALHCDDPAPTAQCSAVVEPGMYFRDFDRETKKLGLELPSYTASREINTVGGMVANDSGGEKNLKYGKTARYVEELEVVLSDGKAHTLKDQQGESLLEKLQEPGFEGDIYRKVSQLLRGHQRLIEEHKPKVEKNSSGYALWDIGDPGASLSAGGPSLNLARLMVGSQGTLGIITKIRFALVRPKPFASMTVIFLKSFSDLGSVVPEVLKFNPDSFESYDDNTFHLAVKYFPEFATQMKAGLIKLGIEFLPELWMLATGGVPKLVLLVEFRADIQAEALRQAKKLQEFLHAHHAHMKASVMKNEEEARKYWVVRRESFNLLRKKVRGLRTAPFIDDFVVPPASLPEFLPKLEAILSRYDLTYTVAGHVGDGNFHIIPLVDPARADTGKIIDELSHKVYDLVLQYHGSITGEHNDGLIRTPYVEKMFGPEMVGLFHEIKNIFDPLNIFNPGKKVGTTFSDAFAKLDLPKVPAGVVTR